MVSRTLVRGCLSCSFFEGHQYCSIQAINISPVVDCPLHVPRRPEPIELEVVSERVFDTQKVCLDGKAFLSCLFKDCEVYSNEGAAFCIANCRFVRSNPPYNHFCTLLCYPNPESIKLKR